MRHLRPPLRDVQREPPRRYCRRCGLEQYAWDPEGELCAACLAEGSTKEDG